MTIFQGDLRRLQLTGFTGPDGKLDRRLESDSWELPTRVELDGQKLIWALERSPEPMPSKRVGRHDDLLTRFIGLADAPDRAIGEYARRFGVLGICEHGIPCGTHGGTGVHHCSRLVDHDWDRLDADPEAYFDEWVSHPGSKDSWDPIAGWRHYARQARAALAIAARVQVGQPGREEDWRTIYEWGWDENEDKGVAGRWTDPDLADELDDKEWEIFADTPLPDFSSRVTFDPRTGAMQLRTFGAETMGYVPIPGPAAMGWWGQGPRFERLLLSTVVNGWADIGGLTLRHKWAISGAPRIALAGHQLFGALAVQLLLAIGRTNGFAHCSACGKQYTPDRRPPPGRRHYCPECGRGAAERDAARDYRRRRKEQPSS
jgi:hypothetical protein